MNPVVDLADKLALFSEHWSPKVVARLNDYEIKVVKLKGEFVWHTHDDTGGDLTATYDDSLLGDPPSGDTHDEPALDA